MKQNKEIDDWKGLVIGLTGSIATGKSTVTKILKHECYPVVDADEIARGIYLKGKPAYDEILKAFDNVLNDEEEIDRQKLGGIVFSDPQALEKLNGITHHYIFDEINEQIENEKLNQLRGPKTSIQNVIFVDMPLLFESNRESIFDEIWVVYIPETIQLERLMKRDGFDIEEAKRRMSSQMSIEEKVKLADKVIDNSLSKEDTKRQVLELIRNL